MRAEITSELNSREGASADPEIGSEWLDQARVRSFAVVDVMGGEGDGLNPLVRRPNGLWDRPGPARIDAPSEDGVRRPALAGGDDLLEPGLVRRAVIVGEYDDLAK